MSVGKDRVFLLTAIIELKTQYETLFKAAMQFSDELEATGRSVGALATQVPAEARSTTLTSMVSGFKLETATFKELLKKLQRDVEKLQSDLPQLDKMAAQNVVDLTHASKTLAHLFKEYQSFIKNGFTSKDVAGFKKSLSKMRLQNGMSMAEVDEALKRVTETSKGLAVASSLYSKDPVNLTTGNFSMEKADLLISGIVPLEFKRTYNTMDDYDGVLGENWVHSFEIVLSEGENNQLKVMMEDGNIVFYTLAKENSYVSQLNPGHQLLKEDEGYRLTTEKQVVYVFNSTGQLLTQTQQTGEVIEFSYNDQKQLKKVTSQSGALRFRYTDEGLLSVIKDNAKRKVQFAYEKSCLTTITLPTKAVLRYGYDKQDKLVSITNPRGIDLVKNEYDHLGRTVKQTFPDEGVMTYVYDDESQMITVTEQNGAQTLYHRDKHYRNTKVVYQDGEEHTAYNEQNQKTAFTDKRGFTTYYSYDDRGNLSKVTNPLGEVTSMTYDEQNQPTLIRQANGGEYRFYYESGNLVKVENPLQYFNETKYDNSNRPISITQADKSEVVFSYDDRGNIETITLPNGGVLTYSYNEKNQVVKTINALGISTIYSYDDEDNLKTVTNALGDTRSYEYNEINKVTQITDFDGTTIQQEYNELGKLSKFTNQDNYSTEIMYDLMWNISQVIEPNGAETVYYYNELNQLAKEKNAEGHEQTYSYDKNNNLEKMSNANGSIQIVYDALNRREKVVAPDGAVVQYRYDKNGQVKEIVNTLGHMISFEYDLLGQLTKQVNEMGHMTTFTYTKLGNVSTATNAKGKITTYSYYPGGKLKQVIFPEGETETYVYDLNDQVVEINLGKDSKTRYFYDDLERLVKTINPLGAVRNYSYDSCDRVTSMTNEQGIITQYCYTKSGHLAGVIDGLGKTTTYDYDAVGNLTQVEQNGFIDEDIKKVEHLNRRTAYQYDLLGNVIESIDAEGNSEKYNYNEFNQMIEKRDKEGYVTKFTYNTAAQINQIEYDDGKQVTFQYNALRQLTSIHDWLGKTSIELDKLGRAKNVYMPDGQVVGYSWDELNNRTQLIYPNGTSVKYTYNSSNKLMQLSAPEGDYHYIYDEYGRLSEKHVPNEMHTEYHYDKAHQLTELTYKFDNEIIENLNYVYSPGGLKTEVIKKRQGMEKQSGHFTYKYDVLNQLTEVENEGKLLRSYSYDAFGNRETKRENNEMTHYSYNRLNQMISEESTDKMKTLHYDKRGNMVEELTDGKITNQMTFDSTNMLSSLINPKGEANYIYNGLRNRVSQTVGKIGEEQENITYLLDLSKPYNNLLERSVNNHLETYLWDSQLLSQDQSVFYMLDDQGTSLRSLNTSGETIGRQSYDEFGIDQIGMKEKPLFGFTGYQHDAISDLFYAQARYYQSSSGQFISKDPILGNIYLPISMHSYGYSMNNPINKTDKSGLWFGLDDLIVGGVGAVVGIATQGVSDVITKVTTGEWDTSIEKYIGSAVGGAVGGVTSLYTGPMVGAAIGTGTSTLVGEGLEKLTGKNNDNSWGDIAIDTGVSTIVGGAVSKVPLPKLKVKGVNSGRNSYSAVYKSGLTKIRNGTASKMSLKVLGKGTVAEMLDSLDLNFLVEEFAMMSYDELKDYFVDMMQNSNEDVQSAEVNCIQ